MIDSASQLHLDIKKPYQENAQGLVYIEVKVDMKQKKVLVVKFRSLEKVYIVSRKLFKSEEQNFILHNLLDAQEMQQDGVPEFRTEFKEYLKDNKCFHLESYEMKEERKEIQTLEKLELNKESFQKRENENAQEKKMKELVAIFNDLRDISEIQQDNLFDALELTYNTNLNVFHNYSDFIELFKKLMAKPGCPVKEEIEEIEAALIKKSKILLFNKFSYQTEKETEENVEYELECNELNSTYYILSASKFTHFNQLSQRLHYYNKTSPYCIFKNLEDSFLNIAYKSFKDFLRSHNKEEQYEFDLFVNTFEFLEKEQQIQFKDKDKDNDQDKEYESLIYKNICTQGILPVNLYLQNRQISSITRQGQRLWGKFFPNPFDNKFHLCVQIMNKFYSFSNLSSYSCFNIFDKEKMKSKEVTESHSTKIRILDFFPLDQWIKILAKMFEKERNLNFQEDIKPLFKKWSDDNQAQQNKLKEEQNNKNSSRIRTFLIQHLKQIIGLEIKSICADFLKEYFHQLKFFYFWVIAHFSSEQRYSVINNNCFSGGGEFINNLIKMWGQYTEAGENLDEEEEKEFFHRIKNGPLNIERPLTKEGVKQLILERKIKMYQMFGGRINKEYLDKKILPLNFESIAKKYQFFCQENFRQYLLMVDQGKENIEYCYKLPLDELEDEEQMQKTQEQIDDQLKIKNFKNNLIIQNIDEAHKDLQKYMKQALQNHIDDIENNNTTNNKIIIDQTEDKNDLRKNLSILLCSYDSWYFQRHQGGFFQNPERKFSYQVKDILKELCYYYYNSVRLSSDALLNHNTIPSLVGHLIIKNPLKDTEIETQINKIKEEHLIEKKGQEQKEPQGGEEEEKEPEEEKEQEIEIEKKQKKIFLQNN